nr:MAG: putative Fe-S cluster assembly protein SufT [Pseudomonadota bacterium]
MNDYEEVRLARDCPAVAVPWGTVTALLAGALARITQRLGGSYTVVVDGNMYRVDGKDADALGFEVESQDGAEPAEPLTAEQVELAAWEKLATCYDPEIPIDIVNLGLVYALDVTPLENGRYRIDVQMTLTAPGCGMGSFIADEAQSKLLSIPGVDAVDVQLVWDPPWSRDMMSEAAKLELGML